MGPSRCHLPSGSGKGVASFIVWRLGREYFEIFSSSLQVKVLAGYTVALESCVSVKPGPLVLPASSLCVCVHSYVHVGARGQG